MLIRQLGGKDGAASDPAAAGKARVAGIAAGGSATGSAGLYGAAARLDSGTEALLNLGNPHGNTGADELLPLTAAHLGAAASPWRQALGQLGQRAIKGVDAAAGVLPGGDPVQFVQALAPHARAAAEKLGVSVRALLAQAALETGWGKHLPTRGDGSSSFNLFGIKAGHSWDGDKVSVPTLEYEDGVAVRRRDNFRAYDDPSQSFADYARMIRNNPRYAQALGQGENIAGFAHALSRGGYATDPAYAAKLTAIANSPQMRQALATLDGAPLK